MTEAMHRQGFAPKTQQSYLRAVRKLAEFYDKSSGWIPEAELCQYFMHRKNVDQWSSTAHRIALCGITFFCQKTLNRIRCQRND
ncbi:phage integrase N-terminal SAM-like domain-containing protein [Planctomycetota bacterium]